MGAQIIGERLFTDGVTRTVFVDESGQFVFDGNEPVYGQWLPPEEEADEPLLVHQNPG